MSDQDNILSTVVYYAREGCYRHMQTVMIDLLIRFGSDPILLFWKGFGMILENRIVEGMRELNALLNSPDVMLAVPLVLIHAHRQCKTIDKEAVQELEAGIRRNRKSCSDKALYYGSMAYWLIGRHDRAREYLDRSLKLAPTAKGLALRGWIDLTCGKDEYIKQSVRFFDEACHSESPPLSAILGKTHYYIKCYQYQKAVDVINKALAVSPSSLPLYLEKMKAQVALQEWDNAVLTAQKCLTFDSNCIQATQILALEQCARTGDMNQLSTTLSKLIEQLNESEPRSYQLYLSSAKTFSRLAGGRPLILQQTQALVSSAISLCSSAESHIEQANQFVIGNDLENAMSSYKKALSLDEGNMSALLGMIHCKLKLKRTKEAGQQLEFLNELQGSSKTAELLFLNALTAHQKNKGQEIVTELITAATNVHFETVKGLPLGLEYFSQLNPPLIMNMSEVMMEYAPSEPQTGVATRSSSVLMQVVTMISPLSHSAPGLLHVQLLLARVHFLSGDSESALSLTQMCIDGDHYVIEALLLQSLIHLQKGNHQQCGQVLETALSNNFEVQRCPLYLLVKGQQHYISGNFKESIFTLQSAMLLKKTPNVTTSSFVIPSPTPSQWVSGYVTLAQGLSRTGKEHEAIKVMQDCTVEYTDTPEEARVTVANAEFLLGRGNTVEALKLLQKITVDKPYYIQAKEHMAEIYLTYEKNKQKYIQCYRELADKFPGPPTALLLGDALMTVQEPEQALQVFEKALKKTPNDGFLANKVGQCYVKMHNFNKAISYYEAALKTVDHSGLRYDLALLYFRLQKYEQAERTLLVALAKNEEANSLQILRDNVHFCQLLTKVYRKTNRVAEAIQILEKARNYQTLVVKTVFVDEPDYVQTEKELMANLLCQLAIEVDKGDDQTNLKAEQYYRESANCCNENPMFRESLARWYLSRGRLEQCEQECITLLKADPNNDNASCILAELLFVQSHFSDSMKQFEDFLTRKPTYYEGLARFIDLSRRVGDVSKAERFIELAESQTLHSVYEPGLNFCKGLYQMYKGEHDKALTYFNHARRDSEWGERALFRMVDICLSTDDILGSETLRSPESDAANLTESSVKKLESEVIAAKTAEKLLREIIPSSPANAIKVKILENYATMLSRSRQCIEKALVKFTELSQHERDNIPCIICMSIAYLLLKQVPRARNLLKRLGKFLWDARNADELERGWILLADVYIQSGKYDLASEQLKKCLKYNKCCSKAYEYLGFIAEKEQAHEDATINYSRAWITGNMSNPALGYRLAFNYLKGRNFISAIDVCHQVLDKYPTYPRIKREILEKARLSLRL